MEKIVISLMVGMLIGFIGGVILNGIKLNDIANEICISKPFPATNGWFDSKSLHIVCQNTDTFNLIRNN